MIFFFLTIFTFRHFPVLIPVPYNSYKIEFSPHQHAVVSQFLGIVSLILCLLLWLTIWTCSYLNLTVHKVVVNVFISHGAWRSYFLYFLSHSLLLFFHSYFMFPYLSYNQPLEWNPSSTESTVNNLDFVFYIYIIIMSLEKTPCFQQGTDLCHSLHLQVRRPLASQPPCWRRARPLKRKMS